MDTATSALDVLFVSNLFPDTKESYRGLDNSVILHGLARRDAVRVLCPRPRLWPGGWVAREEDAALSPRFLTVPYVPKVGSMVNHRIMAARLLPAMRGAQRERRIDVVLCSWLFPDGWAAASACRKLGLPLVLITQGTDTHAYLANPHRRKAILQAAEVAQKIICRSGDLARRLAGAGVPEDKLVTIYNGIDPGIFHAGGRGQARADLGVPAEILLALFVGNLRTVKNPLLLVEAFAQAVRSHSALAQARLVMIGQGEMRAEILRTCQECGVGGQVALVGGKTSGEIARWMQASDALCISSRAEGLPNVLLEALACGLPVVSSHVGGIGEILREPGCGRLAPAGDRTALAHALADVLLHPPDRSALAAYGAQFTWERAIAAYRNVLCAAAGRGQE